jgi:hypothetical protein
MNPLPPINEPIRVTLRHIGLTSFVKWQTLAFSCWGILAGVICTAWFTLQGQLHGRAIASYFLVTVLIYAIPGLIGSIILAVIYNSVARKIGGLEFDIVTKNKPTPSPPPVPWEGTLPKIINPETPDLSYSNEENLK